MINKYLKVILPADCLLAIESILKNNSIRGVTKDKLVYIVSMVYYKQLREKERFDLDFVFLKAEFIKSILGEPYSKCMQLLIRSEIILSRDYYVPKVHSKSYCLNPVLISIKTQWYTITDKRIREKHWKHQDATNRAAKRKYPYLVKWLKYLDLQEIAAKKGLIQLYSKAVTENDIKLIRKCHNMERIIYNFDILRFRHTIGKKGYRLFTLISYLPKELRKHVLFQKKNLVSIDISNSQPYLILWLFKVDPEVKKKQRNILRGTIIQHNNLSSLMIPFLAKTQSSIEFQRYKDLVCKGGFYEQFIPGYARKNNLNISDVELVKKEVKLNVLKSFYSKNSMRIGNGIKTDLHRSFPKISRLLNMIKRPKYQLLSIILQRIESYMVLDVICKRISLERPDIPIFSLHDSIVSTIGNEEYIKNIMTEELSRHIGSPPNIKFDYWQ
jgi:hypothetical protein